jgi:L-2-hydroxyglutarate oxidase LhgO
VVTESGVVEAEALVKDALTTGADAGAIFLPGTRLIGADRHADGMELRTERESIRARTVVNAAACTPMRSRAFSVERRSRFTRAGRVRRAHAVEAIARQRARLSLAAYARSWRAPGANDGWSRLAGADASFQERKDDYESHRLPVEAFLEPARRLLQDVRIEDLRLGGSGIRAKIHSPAESFADFLIRRDRENPFVVQASGIESPGLTSCLAVGDLVASLVESGADLAN